MLRKTGSLMALKAQRKTRKEKRCFAFALAWPQTYCRETGAWYDSLMRMVGVNCRGYYRVGHAAILLINPHGGHCHYYDFGRYHSPAGYGRIRSDYTDEELKLKSTARFDAEGNILNAPEILHEIQYKAATHGQGHLRAANCSINFNTAQQHIKEMQKRGSIAYGPFLWGGSNCSRFVRTAILAGKPGLGIRLKLANPLRFTPLPMGNVRLLQKRPLWQPLLELMKNTLRSCLPSTSPQKAY